MAKNIPELAMQTWPPVYRLRKSSRAKRLHLRFSPISGLEVVVPERKTRAFSFNIEEILNEKRSWIEKCFSNIDLSMGFFKEAKPFLPETLHLAALNKNFTIIYQASERKQCIVREEVGELLKIIGNIAVPEQCILALKKFLKKQALAYLSPALKSLSEKQELVYTGLSIRGQKTVWGSCTPAKKISLNYKLLFFPENIVKYVLIHELCHLQHLNHSKSFWNLVRKYDPNYEEHRKILRNSSTILPLWLEM
jgi:predicted metal-dependent hydrolase